jgi:hypothetical protein
VGLAGVAENRQAGGSGGKNVAHLTKKLFFEDLRSPKTVLGSLAHFLRPYKPKIVEI